jgi:hypothetical protein
MARKKKTDESGGAVVVLIMILIAALATIAVVVTAIYCIVLPLSWLMYVLTVREFPVALSSKMFISTREESRTIVLYEKELADERRELKSYLSDGKGLNQRNDGSFDERSSKGKYLNSAISSAESQIDFLEDELLKLKSYRNERLNHFVKEHSLAKAWTKAAIAFLLSSVVFSFFQPDWFVYLSTLINDKTWIQAPFGWPKLWGVLTVAATLSFTVRLLGKTYFQKKMYSQLDAASEPSRIEAILFTEKFAKLSEIGEVNENDEEIKAAAASKAIQNEFVIDAVDAVGIIESKNFESLAFVETSNQASIIPLVETVVNVKRLDAKILETSLQPRLSEAEVNVQSILIKPVQPKIKIAYGFAMVCIVAISGLMVYRWYKPNSLTPEVASAKTTNATYPVVEIANSIPVIATSAPTILNVEATIKSLESVAPESTIERVGVDSTEASKAAARGVLEKIERAQRPAELEVKKYVEPPPKTVSSTAPVVSSPSRVILNGQWSGTMSCDAYAGSGSVKNPSPWTVPVRMTVNGNMVEWKRVRDDYSETLIGRLTAESGLELSGEGYFNNAPDKPWRTKVKAQLSASELRINGNATISNLNGQVTRNCRVQMDLG